MVFAQFAGQFAFSIAQKQLFPLRSCLQTQLKSPSFAE
jgi:hypothetical protein